MRGQCLARLPFEPPRSIVRERTNLVSSVSHPERRCRCATLPRATIGRDARAWAGPTRRSTFSRLSTPGYRLCKHACSLESSRETMTELHPRTPYEPIARVAHGDDERGS